MELYSLGEILDIIEKGKVAISTSSIDTGIILSVDSEDYIKVKYANNDYSHCYIDLQLVYDKCKKEKIWILMDEELLCKKQ